MEFDEGTLGIICLFVCVLSGGLRATLELILEELALAAIGLAIFAPLLILMML